MEERIYSVYIHRNKINGKIYVGQTRNVEQRWKYDGVFYKKCRYFYHAIEKYGWDNFEHIVLDCDLTKDEADKLEDFYIKYFHSKYNENGYNIRDGGSRGKLSEETRKKLSEINKSKKKWVGDANPRHIHPLVGEENGMYGKHHSDETKQKIGQANKGHSLTEEHKDKIREFMNSQHPRAKKVFCIDTGEVFLSSRKAAEKYGLGNSTVSRICNGERKPGKGKLNWKWYEEGDEERFGFK